MKARIPRIHGRLLVTATAALAALLLSTPALALDTDCDGVDDVVDNCPDKWNPSQNDIDEDGLGDRCDPDKDGDLIANGDDNCAKESNADQLDSDQDGSGDACDECGDGEAGEVVNNRGCSIDQLCRCSGPEEDRAWKKHSKYLRCVKRKAKRFQRNGLIDRNERRETVADARESSCGQPVPTPGDNDGDGVTDEADNCPSDPNPSQRNTDGDAFGNACDSDKDDDGVINRDDSCPVVPNAGTQDDDADGDGVADDCDACSATAAGDVVARNGCAIAQLCPCDNDRDGDPWKNQRKYYRCVRDEASEFRYKRIIDRDQARAIKDAARESTCGEHDGPCA